MFISEIKNILDTETISKVFNIIQQAKFVDGWISGGTPFDREDQEPWLKYLTSIQYTDESHPIVESNKLVASCQN